MSYNWSNIPKVNAAARRALAAAAAGEALRRTGDAARALMTQIKFPLTMLNRLVYGLASGAWGDVMSLTRQLGL